jgi:hypothetical protein
VVSVHLFWHHGDVEFPRIVFVMSPYQNAFFVEIVGALQDELHAIGVPNIVTTEPSEHSVADNDVFVLVPPHEYAALEGSTFIDDKVVAARTIGISAEQPHQGFFRRNAAVGAGLGAVLDFSPLAVAAYRRLGVEALHLQFGYVPAWDRFADRPSDGPLEHPVLYLANKQPRRLSVLATAADQLVAHDATLLISDNEEPNRGTGPAFVAGDHKRKMLSVTGLMVNIHQSAEPYFEWLRFAEAAHSGTPVLSELSTDSAPFHENEHFLVFDVGDLGPALDRAMADRARLVEVAAAAYDTLRTIPLAESIPVLVEAATARLAAPPPVSLPGRKRTEPIGRDRVDRPPLFRNPLATTKNRILRRLRSGEWTVIAPSTTTFRIPPDELVPSSGDAQFINVMTEGRDGDGNPMLEGVWPWQPWRLLHGQHLGRVVVVRTALVDMARQWLSEPIFDDHPHLVVQLFAAAHGISGGHIAKPVASAHGWAIDPSHQMPTLVAERSRQLLDT